MNSTGETRTELANALTVSGNYFDVLGVSPAIGTLFNGEHDRRMGAAPYVVLSYDFWKRRFRLGRLGDQEDRTRERVSADDHRRFGRGIPRASRWSRRISSRSHPDAFGGHRAYRME